jgi:ubiquitin C-terminal hydrolase
METSEVDNNVRSDWERMQVMLETEDDVAPVLDRIRDYIAGIKSGEVAVGDLTRLYFFGQVLQAFVSRLLRRNDFREQVVQTVILFLFEIVDLVLADVATTYSAPLLETLGALFAWTEMRFYHTYGQDLPAQVVSRMVELCEAQQQLADASKRRAQADTDDDDDDDDDDQQQQQRIEDDAQDRQLQQQQTVDVYDDNVTVEGVMAQSEFRYARVMDRCSVIVLWLIEYFGRRGGFGALAARVKYESDKVVALANDSVEPAVAPITVLQLHAFLNPLVRCRGVLRANVLSTAGVSICDSVCAYVTALRGELLRDADKTAINAAVRQCELLAHACDASVASRDVARRFDMLRLSVALNCFSASYLEKRLHGLADIKRMCERVDEKRAYFEQLAAFQERSRQRAVATGAGAEQQPSAEPADREQPPPPPDSAGMFIDVDFMLEWLRRHAIIEALYGGAMHVEMIRRTLELLRFVAVHGKLDRQLIDTVWDAGTGKHETIARTIRQSFADLCPSLSLDQLDIVAQKVGEVPFDAYNNQIISVVRSCTIHSVSKSRELPVERRRIYGLPIMWEMLQDDADASNDMLFQALHFMYDFLNWEECFSERLKYARLCVRNLRNSTSQTQSLRVLYKIFETYENAEAAKAAADAAKAADASSSSNPELIVIDDGDDLGDDSNSVAAMIDDGDDVEQANDGLSPEARDRKLSVSLSLDALLALLDAEEHMLAAFFDDLPVWKADALGGLKAMTDQVSDGQVSDASVSSAYLTGRYEHRDNVRDRLQFINKVVSNSKALEVGADQMDMLWQCMARESLCNFEIDEVFLWLEKAKSYAATTYTVFDDNVAMSLFRSRMAELDVRTLRVRGFSCIKHYFLWANAHLGHIDLIDAAADAAPKSKQPQATPFIVQSLDLVGIDLLWRVALGVRDIAVGRRAISLLLSIDSRLAPHLQDALLEHRRNSIDICMRGLNRAATEVAAVDDDDDDDDDAGDASDDDRNLRVKRCLMIIKSMIDRFEPKHASQLMAHRPPPSALKLMRPLTVSVRKANDPSVSPISVTLRAGDTLAKLITCVLALWPSDNRALRVIVAGRELVDAHATLLDCKLRDKCTVFVMPRLDNGAGGAQSQQQHALDAPASGDGDDVTLYPSSIIASGQSFAQLFPLLDGEPAVADDIWSLLMKLPTHRGELERLSELDVDVTPWPTLLDGSSAYRLLYSLQVVEKLSCAAAGDTERDEARKLSWVRTFAVRGGFDFCVRLVAQHSGTPSLDAKQRESLALLLKIMRELLLNPSKQAKGYGRMRSGILSNDAVVGELLEALFALLWHASGASSSSSSSTAAAARGDDVRQLPPPPPDVHTTLMVQESMRLLVACSLVHIRYLSMLLEHAHIDRWLTATVVDAPVAALRKSVADGLNFLCDELRDEAQLKPLPLPHSFFLRRLLAVLPRMRDEPTLASVAQYFEWLGVRVAAACDGAIGGQTMATDFAPLLADVVDMLARHPVVERRGPPPIATDAVLVGLLSLARSLLEHGAPLEPALACSLLDDVFEHLLFDVPTESNHGALAPPKCKTPASRNAAFELLGALAARGATLRAKLLGALEAQLEALASRDDFSYNPANNERSAKTGFVGLKNQGATCYMNSLMQQFFTIPQFRHALLRVVDSTPDDEKPSSLLWQLQKLMGALQASERQYYDASPFFGAYKDPSGAPVNPLVQMDADEFFNMLLDKVERLLENAKQAGMLNRFFGGKLCHQIISRQCPHTSERDEHFFTLSVDVKNKKNLAESLEFFVQGDMLDGDNKYQCATCSQKVDALKRACVKELPNYLIVHLKRFEFDFETFHRLKVNDYSEFPLELNMLPYTLQGLASPAKGGSGDDEASSSSSSSSSSFEERPPGYFLYDLAGVIVHTGTTEAGHYYSFIRNREKGAPPNGWLQFNDRLVEEFNPAHLSHQCYGGVESQTVYDNYGKESVRFFPKQYSGYMLFYERRSPEFNELKREPLLGADAQDALIPRAIYEDVWRDNADFLVDKHLFEAGYMRFASRVVADVDDDDEQMALAVVRVGTRLACEVIGYAKLKRDLHGLVTRLNSIYSRYFEACRWLVETLCSDTCPWLNQFLFACPGAETREEISRMIVHVIATLRPVEHTYYGVLEEASIEEQDDEEERKEKEEEEEEKEEVEEDDDECKAKSSSPIEEPQQIDDWCAPFDVPMEAGKRPKSLVIRLMRRLLALMKSGHWYWKQFTHFFWVFEQFARMGREERAWLHEQNVIARFVDFFAGTESPYASQRVMKRTRSMGDKSNAARVEHLVEVVSLLARECPTMAVERLNRPTPHSVLCQDVRAASQTPAASLYDFRLSAHDYEMLQVPAYYTLALTQNIKNVEKVIHTACHMCWADQDYSRTLIDAAARAFQGVDYTRFRPFFDMFNALFALRDGELRAWRIEHGLQALLRAVNASTKYPIDTSQAIRYLVELSESNEDARTYLYEQRVDYLCDWLIVSPTLDVRAAAEALVRSFVPEAQLDTRANLLQALQDANKAKSSSSSPTASSSSSSSVAVAAAVVAAAPLAIPTAPALLSEASELRLRSILQHLLSMLEVAQRCTMGFVEPTWSAEEGYPPAFFHLTGYFRLLRWATRCEEDKRVFREWWLQFAEIFVQIDSHHNEADLNKQELLAYWQHCLEQSPETVAMASNSPDVINQLLDLFIAVRPSQRNAEYNQIALPSFYRILTLVCERDNKVRRRAAGNANLNWALQHLYLPPDYPLTANALFDLFALFARSDANYRRSHISVALSRNGVSSTSILRLLEVLVVDADDIAQFRAVRGLEALADFIVAQRNLLDDANQLPPQSSSSPSSSANQAVAVAVATPVAHASMRRAVRRGIALLVHASSSLVADNVSNAAGAYEWSSESQLQLFFVLLSLLQDKGFDGHADNFKMLAVLASLTDVALEQSVDCVLGSHLAARAGYVGEPVDPSAPVLFVRAVSADSTLAGRYYVFVGDVVRLAPRAGANDPRLAHKAQQLALLAGAEAPIILADIVDVALRAIGDQVADDDDDDDDDDPPQSMARTLSSLSPQSCINRLVEWFFERSFRYLDALDNQAHQSRMFALAQRVAPRLDDAAQARICKLLCQHVAKLSSVLATVGDHSSATQRVIVHEAANGIVRLSKAALLLAGHDMAERLRNSLAPCAEPLLAALASSADLRPHLDAHPQCITVQESIKAIESLLSMK